MMSTVPAHRVQEFAILEEAGQEHGAERKDERFAGARPQTSQASFAGCCGGARARSLLKWQAARSSSSSANNARKECTEQAAHCRQASRKPGANTLRFHAIIARVENG
jgi:hypothetical protein